MRLEQGRQARPVQCEDGTKAGMATLRKSNGLAICSRRDRRRTCIRRPGRSQTGRTWREAVRHHCVKKIWHEFSPLKTASPGDRVWEPGAGGG